MSNWTHVAGIIRIDCIRTLEDNPNFDTFIGKECLFEDDESVWIRLDSHPDEFLPAGSEGTLQKSVWINPEKCDIAAYTVSIFGDLRDHDNPKDIIEWFKKKCSNLCIRQAVITVENELNGTLSWTYNDGE